MIPEAKEVSREQYAVLKSEYRGLNLPPRGDNQREGQRSKISVLGEVWR